MSALSSVHCIGSWYSAAPIDANFLLDAESEALDVLLDIMKTNFDGPVCEEQAMKVENVGKMCVCIDEMITDVCPSTIYNHFRAGLTLLHRAGSAGDVGS